MAPTGPGEGGPSGPGVLRMRVGDGRRGSGVQNAGTLPCPRAFRPSGRVRSDLSSPVAASPPRVPWLCAPTRGGAPARSGVGVVLDLRGGAPLGAFVRAGFSARAVFDSVPATGRFTRCRICGALRSVGSCGAGFSARAVFDSVSATGRFTRRQVCGIHRSPAAVERVRHRLGRQARGSTRHPRMSQWRSTRRRSCGRASRRAWWFDSVPATGRFTRRRVCSRSTRRRSCVRGAPLGAFVRASFSERLVVQLSVEDTGAFTRLRIGLGAPLGPQIDI